jgi:hypothetical protein
LPVGASQKKKEKIMEVFDAYITKYALTKGIIKKQVQLCHVDSMVKVIGSQSQEYYHIEGREWHRTYEEAYKQANEMKIKKIASLKKALKKMESLNLDPNQP